MSATKASIGHFTALCVLLLAVAHPVRAFALQADAAAVVFQLGKFDRSSFEFSSAPPEGPVAFVVSKSDVSKDWFGTHPAALGSPWHPKEPTPVSAPRAIIFSITNSPETSYRLHVSLLVESASLPVLKVGINNKKGIFYLHPTLDFSGGDLLDVVRPTYSYADVNFTFPSNYLQPGLNRITLQPVEEFQEAVPQAGIVYDAIELDRLSQVEQSSQVPVEVRPTVFFEKRNGQLKERVDVFLRTDHRINAGSSCELTIGRVDEHLELASDADFGDERLEFLVPEFTQTAQAKVTVRINGRAQQSVASIVPQKKWTLFIVPEIHLDVGFSDYQAKVAAIQSRTIDEALQMMSKHPDFRFSLDGEWDLKQFLASHSTEDLHRAVAAIRQRHLFVPAQYASLLTGIASTETLIRSLYPSANFSRKYGTPFDYANITDVPSYSWSYASILHAAGIHYFIAGSDNARAPVLLRSRLNEHSPVWWEGPDGHRVLLWYSRHYMGMMLLFGAPPLLSAGVETLPLYLQNYELSTYHSNEAIIFGTQVENTDLYPQQAALAGKWNAMYAYPRLEYSGFHDALQSIERQFGDRNITTIRGDGGPYWEDGAASGAYSLTLERQNEARALTAEKLDTLVSLLNPRLKADPAELGSMWEKMVLADEHTWDSYDSASDPQSAEAMDQRAVKESYASNVAATINFIARRSMANLAYEIPANPKSLIVFNGLNWKRDGMVSFDLPKGDALVDRAANQQVPLRLLNSGKTSSRVQFVAQAIPPLGYKVYELEPAVRSVTQPATLAGDVLESPYYRVELDPATGAVRSIYDKELKREIVNQQSPYRFGEYLYVTGGDQEPNTMIRYTRLYPRAKLTVHPAQGGRIVSMMRTPFGEEAQSECQDMSTPNITTEILLFDREKKIEFIEHVDKTETFNKEGVYFAFPFAMHDPKFQYDIQNGVVDPAKDMYPGAGYTWFSVQHWVSAEQGGIAGTILPLDAPLVTLGDINRGQWPDHFGQRNGTIFSYVMNNYWRTNYDAGQGGHFTFRYLITSAETTNSVDLNRMGFNESTPLEIDIVTPQDKVGSESGPTVNSAQQISKTNPTIRSGSQVNAAQKGFMNMSDRNIVLETWKPAEDGDGTILRFVDLGGTKRTINVSFPSLQLEHVWQTDAVERNIQPIPLRDGNSSSFQMTVDPYEILTVRLVERPNWPSYVR